MKQKITYIVLLVSVAISTGLSQSINIDLGQKKLDTTKGLERDLIFDRLEIGDFFELNVSSVGCFNQSTSTMNVTRTEAGYEVSMGDVTKELSESDVADFRGFERELYQLRKGNCTSMDTYTLRYKSEVIRVQDNTCSWNGFSRLKKVLANI